METSNDPKQGKSNFFSKFMEKIKSPEPKETLGADRLTSLARSFKEKAFDSAALVFPNLHFSVVLGGVALLTSNPVALAGSLTFLGAGVAETALWGVREDLSKRFSNVADSLRRKI